MIVVFKTKMGLWGSTMKLPDEEIHAISEDTGCKYLELSSSSLSDICTRLHMGSSINDVTQFITILDPLYCEKKPELR